MPLRGSRFHPRSSGSKRRKSSWEEGPLGTTSGISIATQVLFPTVQQLTLDDVTIIRFRGSLNVYLSAAGGATGEGFTWAFGVCVVTENAFGVGITAVPHPIADVGWDGWFVHEMGLLTEPTATLDQASPMVSERRVLDSKAMRKTHLTDGIVAVFETTELGDGASMQAHLTSRMLVKLP